MQHRKASSVSTRRQRTTLALLAAMTFSYSGHLGLGLALGADAPAAAPAAAPAPAAKAADISKLKAAFNELNAKVQQDTGVTDADVLNLLTMARDLGYPYAANLTAKTYATRHLKLTPALSLAIANNAVAAGDFRSAIARYKAYLRDAAPSVEASEATTKLLTVLQSYTGDIDDAYDSNSKFAEKFRQAPTVKRFDSWFLTEARRRQDFAGAARRLSIILSEGLPLEQERFYYWDELDLLMNEISKATPKQAEALLPLKKLIPLVRENQLRTAKFAFYVANLEFKATSAGREAAELEKNFEAVLTAARAYITAFPTADTLRDIVQVFAGGQGVLDSNELVRQSGQKRAFFVEAFTKIPDADKTAIIGWNYQAKVMAQFVASPEQWVELGAKSPEIFRLAPGTRNLPLVTRSEDATIYAKQAPFLKGVPGRTAATINAQAAGGADLAAIATHLVKNESWHLSVPEIYDILANQIWTGMASDPKAKIPADAFSKSLLVWGPAGITKTPVAIYDVNATKAYLLAAWAYGSADKNDKTGFQAQLDALAWVPYSPAERKDVFGPAYEEYKRWAEGLRAAVRADKKAVTDAQLAQITTVEAGFQEALAPKKPLAAAPDPLCQNLVQLIVAYRDKNKDAYVAAAKALYPLVRDWDVKQTPFGASIFNSVVASRAQSFDNFDFQLEVLKDQLSLYDPAGSSLRLETVINQFMVDRSGWAWGQIPAKDQDKAKLLNAAFVASFTAHLAKDKFAAVPFYWIRGTRSGQGWADKALNQELIADLIEKKTLLKYDFRMGLSSATYASAYLVANEFQGLATKYPIASYFDDMLVEEATKTGKPDASYWGWGQDTKRIVANYTAKTITGFATLPLGYKGEKNPWTREEFWQWFGRAQSAEPATRNAMIEAGVAAFGKTRFDDGASGRATLFVMPDSRKPELRKAAFDLVATVSKRQESMPTRLPPPPLAWITTSAIDSFNDEEMTLLTKTLGTTNPQTWPAGWGFEGGALLTAQSLVKAGRYNDLVTLAPELWRIARDTRNSQMQRSLATMAREISDKDQPDATAVFSGMGLDILGAEMAGDTRTSLTAIRSKSMAQVGGVISVPRSDPRYPLLAAQADFLTGKTQAAWDAYLQRPGLALTMYKELDSSFSLWLIQQNTENRNFEAAEALARQLKQWVDATPAGFDAEVPASLLVAYGDIAFGRQEYPLARTQYDRVVSAAEFENTQARRDAELKIAEVDRVTKQYDKAVDRLAKLAVRQDRSLRAEANYQLALVKFDQEEFQEANASLDQVFSINPDHTNGRILQAKLQLKLKKLMEATQVKVGLTGDQRSIVPGRPLKIELEDKNLAVVGAAQTLEVHVWTDTGDDETFSLFPFGDSKTKFEGSIPTTLGAPSKNDRTLQVLGNSTVSFELAQRGAAKGAEPMGTLTVVTDSELAASSGKILTKEEQEERAMERMIKDRLKLNEGPAEVVAMSTMRAGDEFKPGNPLYIRVADADRSTTTGKNTINVRVNSSSGDVIEAFPLTETTQFSGVFEGVIPTASGQATANASDSNEQAQPNFAISAGNYPAWEGQPDNQRPKSFSVDLNDNVAMGKMSILANVPGRKIKEFVLQTSLNGKQFTTVGSYPTASEPWNGAPMLEVVRYLGPAGRVPTGLSEFEKYVEELSILKGVKKVGAKTPGMKASWDAGVGGLAAPAGLGASDAYIAHLYAAFYLTKSQVKAFQLDIKNKIPGVGYVVAVDGQSGEEPTKVSRMLQQGIHRIDIYVYASRQVNPSFELLTDTPEPPFMIPCAPDLFDPEKQPLIKDAVYVPPAKIVAAEEGGKFDVEFGAKTNARVFRLLMTDFETDAPAIKRITLNDAQGKQILPVTQDFMELRRNQVVEVVPGDKVTITYEDPKVISKNKKVQQTSLSTTYSDAQITACFVEFELVGSERRPQYIPMRRFKAGDPVQVFIKDPDCDTTDGEDKVTFTANFPGEAPITITALETEKHSGIYMGTIVPVAGVPGRPNEIQLKEGLDLTLTYVDKENTNPGIPWPRTARIEQAIFSQPELRVYTVESEELSDKAKQDAAAAAALQSRALGERVEVTRTLTATRPVRPATEKDKLSAPADGPLIVELTAPQLAMSPKSNAIVYVQTATARKAAGKTDTDPYDLTVPGTVRLDGTPSAGVGVEAPPGYQGVTLRGGPSAETVLDLGRFTYVVPVQLGAVPEKSMVEENVKTKLEKTPLMVNGADDVYIGFTYKDAAGAQKWLTQKVSLVSDLFFEVMDRRYQDAVDSVHVGEKVYFRVIHKSRDVSDEKDNVTLDISTVSGAKHKLTLSETFGHSGIFKGVLNLSFAGEKQPTTKNSLDDTMPVTYGDVITAKYAISAGKDAAIVERKIDVFKGADGTVIPFTRKFKDPAIAVQTQFTIAEAYFELAKKHREVAQESLSRREIAQGKKLLEEAIRDYPDTTFRAQADYLLANLAGEFATDATNPVVKKQFQTESIQRYGEILLSYPDSPYAPKAQFKKALMLEKMGEIDQACEEYVKLSYRYPENELVADTIARLGQYFQSKGQDLMKKVDTETEPVAREKLKMQSLEMYKTAGQVFGRLSERFPAHKLAGKTLVLSAQCYYSAADFDRAIEIFKKIMDDPKMEKELVAISMYWCGDSYTKKPAPDMVAAYRMFKKLTWDYPESQWAKFARGRLTDEAMVAIETKESTAK